MSLILFESSNARLSLIGQLADILDHLSVDKVLYGIKALIYRDLKLTYLLL